LFHPETSRRKAIWTIHLRKQINIVYARLFQVNGLYAEPEFSNSRLYSEYAEKGWSPGIRKYANRLFQSDILSKLIFSSFAGIFV
jgi:hypothetical protein